MTPKQEFEATPGKLWHFGWTDAPGCPGRTSTLARSVPTECGLYPVLLVCAFQAFEGGGFRTVASVGRN